MCEIKQEAQFFAWVLKKLTPAQFELMRSIKENSAAFSLSRTDEGWNHRAVQSLIEIGLLRQFEAPNGHPVASLTQMGRRVCQHFESF